VSDSTGQTIDFLLTAKRDAAGAKRFFRKAFQSTGNPSPRVVNVDKNPAYPAAMEAPKAEGVLPSRVRLRQCKYLNNILEQDHRSVKKRVWPAKGYGSFQSAWRTLQGIETMHMINKGRVRWLAKATRSVRLTSSPASSASLSRTRAPSPFAPPLWDRSRHLKLRNGTPVPVLLELFTSEGCSSCPPADHLLEILDQQPISGAELIVLSEHVDYWDGLGWKDPFSSPQFTARQQDYASRFKGDGPYTPQLVVNGRFGFVGSDAREAESAIHRALRGPKLPIAISQTSRTGSQVAARIGVPAADSSIRNAHAVLYVALARRPGEIPRGEGRECWTLPGARGRDPSFHAGRDR
jgi:hypothetical protein